MRHALTSGDDGRVEPVYDVLRAGPRSRFCTPWVVAHNCLGLQFGLGPTKFRRIYQQWTGKEISEAEAKRTVWQYRDTNKPIVDTWKYLERQILNHTRDADGKRGTNSIELPSGRHIRYFDLREGSDEERSSWTGCVVRGENRRHIYGGLLMENATQATARDVFATKIHDVEGLGLPVVLHVHDELVIECPEDVAEEAKAEVDRTMATAPEWAEGLPIKAETKIMRRYEKR